MASLPEFAAAVILAAILVGEFSSADGKELRPSDHGLVFQSSPPANSSPESMRSFFNADAYSSSNSSPSSSTDMSPFPEASNFTAPPEWWSTASSDGGRVRRLGGVLVVASLVCGVTGVALLVATGVMYLFNKHKRRKSELNESFRCGDNDDAIAIDVYNSNNENRSLNKLQLVAVRNS